MAADYSENARHTGAPTISACILALETSSEACSVALLGEQFLVARHCVAPRRHTELLIEMIDAVMSEAGRRPRDIDLLAFGCGPGSFTGVRIAAAVAQGIAMAHALPLVPVSSLAALASGAARLYGARSILAALDARRGEIYLGAYRDTDTGLDCISPDQVLPPGALELPSANEAWFAVGHGWDAYAGRFSPACAKLPRLRLPYPLAEDIARLARAAGPAAQVSAAEAMPIYLRAALD